MTPARADRPAPAWMVWAGLWIVYIIWGSTYLAIRIAVETLPSLLMGGLRFLLAGLIIGTVLVLRRGRSAMKVTKAEVAGSALIGSLLCLGGNGLVTIAEESVPSGLAALLVAAVPLWVIIWRAIARERIPFGTMIGVIVGFVGVAVLVMPGGDTGGASIGGMLLVVLASSLWATGSFFSRRVTLPKDPFVSTSVQMLTGGLAMLLAGTIRGEWSGVDPSTFSTSSVMAFLYLIVFGSLVAFTSYVWLLQHAPVSKVATYAYVNPVVAIFLGWLILDEVITATIVIGATVIVASVAAIVQIESRAERDVAGEGEPSSAPALENESALETA